MFCTEIVHILLCCIGLCVYFQHEPICELISLNCVPADLKLVSRGCRSCPSIYSRWWFRFAVSPFPAVRACPLSMIFNSNRHNGAPKSYRILDSVFLLPPFSCSVASCLLSSSLVAPRPLPQLRPDSAHPRQLPRYLPFLSFVLQAP